MLLDLMRVLAGLTPFCTVVRWTQAPKLRLTAYPASSRLSTTKTAVGLLSVQVGSAESAVSVVSRSFVPASAQGRVRNTGLSVP